MWRSLTVRRTQVTPECRICIIWHGGTWFHFVLLGMSKIIYVFWNCKFTTKVLLYIYSHWERACFSAWSDLLTTAVSLTPHTHTSMYVFTVCMLVILVTAKAKQLIKCIYTENKYKYIWHFIYVFRFQLVLTHQPYSNLIDSLVCCIIKKCKKMKSISITVVNLQLNLHIYKPILKLIKKQLCCVNIDLLLIDWTPERLVFILLSFWQRFDRAD